ncbi:MAG: carboxymuconolactone decarboxylase family protein [Actinobacteria bacterium]|nr:MAG: carboxymuconolactone decarboxylase family protein [Actinomycetota bacterium]
MADATAGPWRGYAPAAFLAFDRAEAVTATTVAPGLLDPVRRAVAQLLMNPDELVRTPPATDTTPDSRADVAVRFAEQFVVDVSGITDAHRAELVAALGDEMVPFVQALYVVDVFQRGRIALTRLYGADFGPAPAPGDGELWPVLEEFMRVVARGSALDPLTTEIIRLRGARAHNCRICQSRLSVRAVDAAGDASAFDAIDDYEHSDLPERHKVALRLADAVLSQPMLIDRALVEQVGAQFSPEATTEIVLDVVRNAANKFAVAVGGDAAQVDDGIEYFDLDTAGDVVADVDPEVVRELAAR